MEKERSLKGSQRLRVLIRFLVIFLLAFHFGPMCWGQQQGSDLVKVKLATSYKRPMKIPSSNPMTKMKVELGRKLFFDQRLSVDNSMSCASCHDPQHGWAQNSPNAAGFKGQTGNRNTPSVLNAGLSYFQFWDGRAGSLEEQALGPIENPIEMNLPIPEMEKKLGNIKEYQEEFQKVFGSGVTRQNVAKALAAFERTIVSDQSPYDEFKAGKKDALTESEKRGMELFFGQANCSSCHSGPNFTDNGFHNLGVGFDKEKGKFADPGRFAISKLEGDTGSFKTPSLRDVALTPPYMHDGSKKTLREVIDFYDQGGQANPWLDEEMFEIGLTDQEKKDLEAFLRNGLKGKKSKIVLPPK